MTVVRPPDNATRHSRFRAAAQGTENSLLEAIPRRHKSCRSSALRRFAQLFFLALLSPSLSLAAPAKTPGAATPSTSSATPAISLPSTVVCTADAGIPTGDLDAIVTANATGDWPTLQEKLKVVADHLRNTTLKPKPCTTPPPGNARLSFVFIDDHLPQPAVVRVLQGDDPPPSAASTRLIRQGKANSFFAVYLFRDDKAPLIYSTYTASPAQSPVQASLAQAISTAAGGLGKIVSPMPLTAGMKGIVPNLPQALVTEVTVPSEYRWAQVTATDNADVTALQTPDEVHRRAASLPELPPILVTMNDNLRKAFPASDPTNPSTGTATPASGAKGCAAYAPGIAATEANACLNTIRDLSAQALTNQTAAVRFKAQPILQMYTSLPLLAPASGAPSSATTGGTSVTAQTTYTFGPLTHWSFGLGAGAVFHPNLNQQVKLSGTTLVDDPLNGVFTSVNVYHNLWLFSDGYDETTPTPQWTRESPRFVLGAVLTPNPGLFAGLGFALPFVDVRNVLLNAGYAVMLATVPVGNEQVGANPAKTRRGALGAWAVQVGYGF